jgi:hypothetical protein
MKTARTPSTFVPLFTYDQQSSEEASNKQEISFLKKKNEKKFLEATIP